MFITFVSVSWFTICNWRRCYKKVIDDLSLPIHPLWYCHAGRIDNEWFSLQFKYFYIGPRNPAVQLFDWWVYYLARSTRLDILPPVSCLVWFILSQNSLLTLTHCPLMQDTVAIRSCYNFRQGGKMSMPSVSRNYIQNHQVEWIWTFVIHIPPQSELFPDSILEAPKGTAKNNFHFQSLCCHFLPFVCPVQYFSHRHEKNILEYQGGLHS